MELNVLNEQGKTVEAADAVFGREYNEALVHQIVVAFQANARLGTRAQLNRRDVHHSTKKPWRQKGTGRARSGMTSSPLWRSGGRAFPNTPYENFSQKLNKKMFRAGMASIYSKLVADARFVVVETIKADLPKTKAFASQLKTLGLTARTLIIVDESELDDNLILAAHRHRYIPDTAHGRAVVDQRSHGFHRLSSFKRFEWVLPLLETDESWLLPRRVHTERRRGTWHRYCVAPLQTPVRT